ncbi:MAG: hypothetical protein R3357_10090 [Burkholderiales bacterium]|nr:hypothetical protein [Burkholderiales bacterium]
MQRLDAQRFARHFTAFVALADAGPGLAAYVESLEAKHRLFADALAPERRARLGLDAVRALLETAFTARRKLFPLLERMDEGALRAAIGALMHGAAPADARIAAFCAALPFPPAEGREARMRDRRLRGAAHDFAAELLHFADPQAHPLMTRWVWDAGTSSGALRELMNVPENAAHVSLEASAGTYAAARDWITERVGAQGIYRDHHWWADLLLAMAYVEYFRAMTGGTLGSDFTRASTPDAQLRKLLGIEPERVGGRSRVKPAAGVH